MENRNFTTGIYKTEYGQGIADCFRAIYGESYAVKTVYDPSALQREFELGNLYFAVALNGNDEVVGCEAVYRSTPPFQLIYEAGAGVVLPAYRHMGIQYVLLDVLTDYLEKHTSVEEIFGEAVCNHLVIQKMMYDKGAIETAIEVEPIPAGTFAKEGLGSGRVSTLLQFKNIKDRPHDIYVPQCYHETFEMLYANLKRERRLSAGSSELSLDVVTHGDVVIFHHANVARLVLNRLGKDLSRFMEDYDASIKDKNIEVSQVCLPLDQPSISEAVGVLRSKGYFLGGILPRWFDCDGMLMQRVLQKPNWDNIKLFSQTAKIILEKIRKDWDEAPKTWPE